MTQSNTDLQDYQTSSVLVSEADGADDDKPDGSTTILLLCVIDDIPNGSLTA